MWARKLLTFPTWPLVSLITGFTGIPVELTQQQKIPSPWLLATVLIIAVVPVRLRVIVLCMLRLLKAAITQGLKFSIPLLWMLLVTSHWRRYLLNITVAADFPPRPLLRTGAFAKLKKRVPGKV